MTVLGMFFTRGVSLRKWVESGLFDREVQIYHSHIKSGYFSRVYWFTYGVDDTGIASELHESGRLSKSIEIIPCPQWIRLAGRGGSVLYSFLLPLAVARIAARCDVFKTNQMEGSIPALICASIWQRPLYVRTGYTLSRVIEKTSPGNWVRRMVAMANEYLSFRFASASSVSSRYDRDYIIQRYGTQVTPPMIIGNYVDTLLFSPFAYEVKVNDRVLYVGRLSPEKNLDNAIAACATVGLGLDIIGAGAELLRLKEIAIECGANVRWLGVIPNNQLPDLFSNYRYFILPSYWEGLPKALIEAMSAGLICIGNDTTGINEIIEEGVTGYLSPSPVAIALAETLRRALAGDHIKISRAGREFACNNFSLDAITAKEKAIFTHILTKK
jgi:glycosyltransferase involved in cell wall biosynthesis